MVSTLVGVTSHVTEGNDDGVTADSSEESRGLSPQKLAGGLLNIPLSNVGLLKTTLSSVSITEMIELVRQFVHPSNDVPDKKKLFSVQDFFRYNEAEGMYGLKRLLWLLLHHLPAGSFLRSALADSSPNFNAVLSRSHITSSTNWGSGIVQGFYPGIPWPVYQPCTTDWDF